MTDFYADFHGVGANGQTAEQYFYSQIFNAVKENTELGTLPLFNRALNKIPRELSTGKIINNENLIMLEQVASKNGYKSNLWIYGDELNKLQKEVGNLYYKKGTQPALCLTKYFGSTHLNEQDLYIAEGGSGKKEQYLYNLDSLDERSREKVMKYYQFSGIEVGAVSAFPVFTAHLSEKMSVVESLLLEERMKRLVRENAFTDAALPKSTVVEKYDIKPGLPFFDAHAPSLRSPTIERTWETRMNPALFHEPAPMQQQIQQEKPWLKKAVGMGY